MPFVTVAGLRIHYALDSGPTAGGLPVLLIHGLGSSSEDWVLQTEALAADRPVAAVDLPGHGRSNGYHTIPRLEDFAAAAAAVGEDLGWGEMHVVGLSLGGSVGLTMALEAPERVASLVAVSAPSRRGLAWTGILLGASRLAAVAAGRVDWAAKMTAWDLFPRADQRGLREIAAERLADNTRGGFLRAVAALARMRLRNRLGEIGCPVLVVAGENDRTVPLGHQREVAQCIRRGRFLALPESGHAIPIDAPDRFNRIVRSFLDDVDDALVERVRPSRAPEPQAV